MTLHDQHHVHPDQWILKYSRSTAGNGNFSETLPVWTVRQWFEHSSSVIVLTCMIFVRFQTRFSFESQAQIHMLSIDRAMLVHWPSNIQARSFMNICPHWVNVLLLCQPGSQYRPHTHLIRIILFSRWTRRPFPTVFAWTFSQPCFDRIFSNCLSQQIVLPKDDRTDSVREEPLDLPYWTMIVRPFVHSRRRTSQIYMDNSWLLELVQVNVWSILHFFHLGVSRLCVCCLSIAAMVMSATKTDQNNNCFRWTQTFPVRYSIPIQVPTEFLRTVFPTRGQQVGDHADFVQEKTTGSSMFGQDLGQLCLEDVSIYLDILTWEFWAIWERPPILPGCRLIRCQLLVHHSLVVRQWHPLLLRPSFVMLMILAQ